MNKIQRFSAFTLMTISILLMMSFKPKNKLQIDGAWKVVVVELVKADGSFTSIFPVESQVFFAHKHYSFCWTSHQSTTHSWQIADSVKLARFNQSIVNAGTYELKDSILTTKATFAMSPMFVNGLATFKCSFQKDTLYLNGLSVNSSGNIPNPVYANGSHFTTKLIKIKD